MLPTTKLRLTPAGTPAITALTGSVTGLGPLLVSDLSEVLGLAGDRAKPDPGATLREYCGWRLVNELEPPLVTDGLGAAERSAHTFDGLIILLVI